MASSNITNVSFDDSDCNFENSDDDFEIVNNSVIRDKNDSGIVVVSDNDNDSGAL